MAKLLTAYRVLVFALILLLIQWRHDQYKQEAAALSQDLSGLLPEIVVVLPDAASILPAANDGLPQVVDRGGSFVGTVLRTSPFADHIVGFSGPSDLLLVFDQDDQAILVRLLSSDDTRDHV